MNNNKLIAYNVFFLIPKLFGNVAAQRRQV